MVGDPRLLSVGWAMIAGNLAVDLRAEGKCVCAIEALRPRQTRTGYRRAPELSQGCTVQYMRCPVHPGKPVSLS